eukprot:gnl/Chilomastix_caulleri/582.p1 GENE.gnl/Chilomastix_caulleri/582~~gnl/Chilomastix_caulleri/582.p1  ORF type:complete len:302 (+),score=77.89 gnl/Chilomastix_caulleri/582:103-1008(+)
MLKYQNSKISLRSVLKGHTGKVFNIAWHRDSRTLLSASQDETMISWDGVTKQKNHYISFTSSFCLSCCYHPVEPVVLAGGVYSNINVIGIPPMEEPVFIKELKAHNNHVSSINFLNRKQFISSGDKTVYLWDYEHQQKVGAFKCHRDFVTEAFPAPDGSTFVSGGCDRTAIIWDLQSGKPGYIFPGHEGDVNAVHFFPTGLSFATGCEDGRCAFWDIRSNKCLMTYVPGTSPQPVNSINFSNTGRILFAGYDNGCLVGYDILKGTKVFDVKAHSEGVRAVRVSPNGMAIASCGDSDVKIWA